MAQSDTIENKPKGWVLKQAREDKGLSLQTIHDLTKIPIDILKAIEEGYTVRTLSPFYLKGFVKMYAKQLGVDVREVLDVNQVSSLPEPIQGKQQEDEITIKLIEFFTPQRQRLIAKSFLLFILLFFAVKILGSFLHKGTDKLDEKKIKGTTKIQESSRQPREEKRKNLSVSEERATPEAIPSSEVLYADSKPISPIPPVPAIVKSVSLTVRATKKGWLQVTTDGVPVFQSTIKQGDTETWQADGVIELSGKNIDFLEFEVNGKMIGLLGRADRGAKRIVVTKDGLTVKK